MCTWMSHVFRLTLSCLVMVATVSSADDCVVVKATEGGRTIKRNGEILDYSGDALTLRLPTGREEQIPSERIVEIETAKSKDHVTADQLCSESQYGDALTLYRRAVNAEQRTWMRRLILAEMVRCYQNNGQTVAAIDTFLIVFQSDPKTHLMHVIPLTWTTGRPDPNLAGRAVAWCDDKENAVAALIGASWLLAGPERGRAISTLKRLAAESHGPITRLAESQLWRTAIVTASANDLNTWQDRIKAIPEPLRAGPYFVLGRGLAQHKQHEQAALALMRVPVLYFQERDLAAEALLLAGEQMERAGNADESNRIYEELVVHYKGHELESIARDRLERNSQQK